jgi:hypothetical protein
MTLILLGVIPLNVILQSVILLNVAAPFQTQLKQGIFATFLFLTAQRHSA